MLEKIKIFLIPHSHWDREWYFSYQAANVLWHQNLQDFIKNPDGFWFLDGQWSIVDQSLQESSDYFEILKKAFQKGQISCGPLYSQPDVLNSQAETIIRNFELGKEFANKFEILHSKTAYLPDTFGFGQNFPNLLRHCQIEKFIFWRGLNSKQLNEDVFFNWITLDQKEVKAYVLQNGYFPMGFEQMYDLQQLAKPEKMLEFLNAVNKIINSFPHREKSYYLPIGLDQAPFLKNQKEVIQLLNQQESNYHFTFAPNYDNLFSNRLIEKKYQGDLRSPITGKIHRTISSSRYDIKKLFRDVEDKLYYLLEPLEIFYQQFDESYDFENYKKEHIIKPLLIAQSHDSLAGCNTDLTNQNQLIRLKQIDEQISSQIDLLIKKVVKGKNFDSDLLIFNPASFTSDYFGIKKLYFKDLQILNFIKENLVVKTVSTKNISFADFPLYEIEVMIFAKNLKPLMLHQYDKLNSTTDFKVKEINPFLNNQEISFTLGDQKLNLKVSLEEDQGDSYDFSFGKQQKLEIKHHQAFLTKINDQLSFFELAFYLNHSLTKVYGYYDNENLQFEAKIDNHFTNSRLSLEVELVNSQALKIMKSQTLALVPFMDNDYDPKWKNTWKEYPFQADVNDGLISLNSNLHILTKGTNEFYQTEKGVKIILYRTHQYVSRANLKTRPIISGLNWKEKANDAQLQKELVFDFAFKIGQPITALNKFKYRPYAYQNQNLNFLANKMDKFIINQPKLTKQFSSLIKFKKCEIFISAFFRIKDHLYLRLANMVNQEIINSFNYQGKNYEIKFKPYEIKLITLKG